MPIKASSESSFRYKVALLIPCYNNSKGLLKTLSSISEPQLKDKLLVVLVDDGSVEPIRSYVEQKNYTFDVEILVQSTNLGIVFALNEGLCFSIDSCQYIARLDAGDYNVPDRLFIQSEFLDKHADIGLIGSWAEFINEHGDLLTTRKPPADHLSIKRAMYLNNILIHPTVMFRSDLVKNIGYYPNNYPAAEDYAFFMKAMSACHVANIETPLVRYLMTDNSISTRNRRAQVFSRLRIQLLYFKPNIYSIVGVFRSIFLVSMSREMAFRLGNFMRYKR